MKIAKPSRLREAILEIAEDMHQGGIMSEETYHQITVRDLGPKAPLTATTLSGEDIRLVREQANLSQAALAKYLGLTAGYISQLERGAKQAKGPALALLNVIRRKGIEVLQ
jgi:putative transcriptional regulator